MGGPDLVLESISGHLSRRVLEHYSHIRIAAKRKALDDLDAERELQPNRGSPFGIRPIATSQSLGRRTGGDTKLLSPLVRPAVGESSESNGEMSEWLKEHAWKACVGETLPRVRIPLSPPISLRSIGGASGLAGSTGLRFHLGPPTESLFVTARVDVPLAGDATAHADQRPSGFNSPAGRLLPSTNSVPSAQSRS